MTPHSKMMRAVAFLVWACLGMLAGYCVQRVSTRFGFMEYVTGWIWGHEMTAEYQAVLNVFAGLAAACLVWWLLGPTFLLDAVFGRRTRVPPPPGNVGVSSGGRSFRSKD